MYRIACIMGKSATGKDHIYKALLEREELSLRKVVMYTTRPMREGEEEGVEYHFVSDKECDSLAREDKIIEMRVYNTVHGEWKYFTADDGQIDMENGRYLMIGTLETYENICKYFGKDNVMPIYIEVDDGIRLERAMKREKKQAQPKYAEMCRRYLADNEDFDEKKLSEAGIDKRYSNDGEIEECIDEVAKDIGLLMKND